MPSFNSTMYTGQTGSAGQTTNATTSFPLAQLESGKLRYTIVQYALSTEATNDTINLCKLKIGTKIIPSLSKIVCEDPGTALTLDIGDAGDADRYLDGAALTTAHDDFFTKLPSVTATASQYVPVAVTAGNETIVATVVLATTLTNAAKVTIYLAWVEV